MAIVLGIIGVVAEGLLYMLLIGIVVLVAALFYLALHLRHGADPAAAIRGQDKESQEVSMLPLYLLQSARLGSMTRVGRRVGRAQSTGEGPT
ncbi:hypothetical protein OG361_01630 [Streptomyces sp. NBC_00090]|uniref:hypothetical protein n=1 Tax=Streptomyces sp. NBC_00090 TaxID=2903619 RepID=UPI00324EA739